MIQFQENNHIDERTDRKDRQTDPILHDLPGYHQGPQQVQLQYTGI